MSVLFLYLGHLIYTKSSNFVCFCQCQFLYIMAQSLLYITVRFLCIVCGPMTVVHHCQVSLYCVWPNHCCTSLSGFFILCVAQSLLYITVKFLYIVCGPMTVIHHCQVSLYCVWPNHCYTSLSSFFILCVAQ